MKFSFRNFCACVLISGIVLTGFASCASTKAFSIDEQASVQEISSQIVSLELDKGEVWVRNVPAKDEGELFSVNPFFATQLMSVLDSYLDFESVLTEKQLNNLTKALCYEIRFCTTYPDYRCIAVGDYFGEGKNLLIDIQNIELYEGVAPGKEYGIQINMNFTTGKILKSAKYAGLKFPFSVQFVPFEDGKLVLGKYLNNGKVVYSPELSPSDLCNMMDFFLYDEDDENDLLLDSMYEESMANEDDYGDVTIAKNTAELNEGLWLLKQGKSDEARAFFHDISLEYVTDDYLMNVNHEINYSAGFVCDIYDYAANGYK